MGLGPLRQEVRGKTVLDVGCAEGGIDFWLAPWALRVVGIEVRKDAVEEARADAKRMDLKNVHFRWQDATQPFHKDMDFDIVLMLAVLHKVKDPTAMCRHYARVARDLVVIRLPPATAPRIIDKRSDNVPHDIHVVMRQEGFEPESTGFTGPYGEWVGYYRRRNAQEADR